MKILNTFETYIRAHAFTYILTNINSKQQHMYRYNKLENTSKTSIMFNHVFIINQNFVTLACACHQCCNT